MAQFDEPKLRESLQQLAVPAKSDLAWIAANHTFFKSHQQGAPGAAAALLALPERFLGVEVEKFASPKEARDTWHKAVNDFHKLRDYVSGSPTDDPGHYLNKAAVVYAVAIVEGFLTDAHCKTWQDLYQVCAPTNTPSSVRSLVGILAGLRNHKGKYKSGNAPQSCPENKFSWARDALFLAQIRHAIVHSQGRVDDEFLEKVGTKPDKQGNQADAIWAKDIWSTLADFQTDFKPPDPNKNGPEKFSPVCLNITKVIIPYLTKCADFIDTAVEKFITAANNWPTNP